MNTSTTHITLRFRQEIMSGAQESYHVAVVSAPGSGWGGSFLPGGLDNSYIQAVRSLYRDYLARIRTRSSKTISEDELEAWRAAGNQMFQALPETVQTRLHQVQATAQAQGKHLQLTLVFEPNAYALLSLPWELLHHPEGGYFFALRGGGVTRQLALPVVPPTHAPFVPRSVLGVWAEPEGLESLEARRAYAPAPGHGLDMNWIEGGNTLYQLQRALDMGGYDSLHIVAHGRTGGSWRDFSLAFTGENGAAHWITPDQLATLLAQYPEIRFVYLDVCASGEGRRMGGADITGGLARQLLGLGLTGIVVMHDVVPQDVAGVAAQNFYQAARNGASLPHAMTRARRAVRLTLDDPIHWGVFNLYEQSPPVEERSWSLKWIDGLLDTPKKWLAAETFLGLALFLLIGWLAGQLAALAWIQPPRPRALAAALAGSVGVVLLSAAWMQYGQPQLDARYRPGVRGWLLILAFKYFSAAVWAMMAWALIALGWLAAGWVGLMPYLGPGARQLGWVGGLLLVSFASYAGARQAIRRKMLFMRGDPTQRYFRNWTLLLPMLFTPTGLFLASIGISASHPQWACFSAQPPPDYFSCWLFC